MYVIENPMLLKVLYSSSTTTSTTAVIVNYLSIITLLWVGLIINIWNY